MHKIHLQNDRRPMFVSYSNGFEITSLLDTGALLNVYTGNAKEFLLTFPDAVLADKKTFIGGFGGNKSTLCDIYIVPELVIGDIVIHNLPVAIQPNDNIHSDLILASCIFQKWKFSIDYCNGLLELDCNRRDIYVKNTLHETRSDIITGFFVFTQKEDLE